MYQGLPKCMAVFISLSIHMAAASEIVAPYVDTVREDVELILELADVGPEDYLVDLGSGDGRFVIEAAKRGAMALGVELDKKLVDISRANARAAGVSERALFVHEDLFNVDFSMASVVTLYLMPEVNLRLRPILLESLRPGTRVVSNSFDMGDWKPDARVQGRTSGGALLWYIPAKVSGGWTFTFMGRLYEVQITQTYQDVVAESSKGFRIEEMDLQGTNLRFLGQIDDQRYTFQGEIVGALAIGTARSENNSSDEEVYWRAERNHR